MTLPIDDNLNELVIAVARGHRLLAGKLLAELGLHPGQERLLLRLWERDGRTQVDLAGALGVEPPTVSRMLSSMERGGLITRRPSSADGRAVIVELTDHGRRLEPRFRSIWNELEEQFSAGLTARERRDLARLLRKVAPSLDRSTSTCGPEEAPSHEKVALVPNE